MNQPEDNKPIGAVWRRVRDLAPEYHSLRHEGARMAAVRWKTIRAQLEDRDVDRSSMEIWLREQRRAFAIETGQIEGLYLLHRGVTETLITEGFENVRGAHSVGHIGDETLKGLLTDQEAALEMMFAHVKDERPLTASAIKEWHALLTRHQESATGIDHFGRRVEIPLRKGEWKIRPNNPRRQDGFVHEYCPPEQVQSEIDRFLDFHARHRALDLAPETAAAWLHHEFVRIHPFQDGNGRISRLLMAHAYAKAGEFPPIIPAQNKLDYITALEAADEGNFRTLVTYFGDLAAPRSNAAAARAERILHGRTHYRHGNGGVTRDGEYHPPIESQPLAEGPLPLHEAVRSGDLDTLRRHLDDGEDPDMLERPPHSARFTALHWAAMQENIEAASLLIAAQAQINIPTAKGTTALHLAADHASPEMVQTLIDAKADVNARDSEGETPLHAAARRKDPQAATAIIAVLLDASADPRITNTTGHTSLDVARANESLSGTDACAYLERETAPPPKTKSRDSSSSCDGPLHGQAAQNRP